VTGDPSVAALAPVDASRSRRNLNPWFVSAVSSSSPRPQRRWACEACDRLPKPSTKGRGHQRLGRRSRRRSSSTLRIRRTAVVRSSASRWPSLRPSPSTRANPGRRRYESFGAACGEGPKSSCRSLCVRPRCPEEGLRARRSCARSRQARRLRLEAEALRRAYSQSSESAYARDGSGSVGRCRGGRGNRLLELRAGLSGVHVTVRALKHAVDELDRGRESYAA
jgi:hypothetical protein